MEPHRIDVPERFGLKGAYVLIRPKQSWSALNRVQSAGLLFHGGVAADTANIDVMGRGLAVLETAVVSWHGVEDGEGRPLPASRRGYLHDDFDAELGDWLVDEINSYYAAQRRSTEEGSAEGKAEAPSSPLP